VRVLAGVETLPGGTPRLTEVRDWRYSRDAVLYKDYLDKDGGGISNIQVTYLVTVDLSTAVLTNVGVQTELMDGLAFVPTSVLP
jgi:hypothetical protein